MTRNGIIHSKGALNIIHVHAFKIWSQSRLWLWLGTWRREVLPPLFLLLETASLASSPSRWRSCQPPRSRARGQRWSETGVHQTFSKQSVWHSKVTVFYNHKTSGTRFPPPRSTDTVGLRTEIKPDGNSTAYNPPLGTSSPLPHGGLVQTLRPARTPESPRCLLSHSGWPCLTALHTARLPPFFPPRPQLLFYKLGLQHTPQDTSAHPSALCPIQWRCRPVYWWFLVAFGIEK